MNSGEITPPIVREYRDVRLECEYWHECLVQAIIAALVRTRAEEQVSRDTDKDWGKVAEENPFWGVLSDDRFKGTEIAGAERELFFRSGEASMWRLG